VDSTWSPSTPDDPADARRICAEKDWWVMTAQLGAPFDLLPNSLQGIHALPSGGGPSNDGAAMS
jgi:hypothetical protein